MISLTVMFTILIVHWIADFVLQTDKQAKGKSKNWAELLSHTVTYSLAWIVPAIIMLGYNGAIFVIITLVAHTITDYFTSRLNSKLWGKGDVHNFFVSIGFDQVLHYTQLILTYYYLTT